MDKVPSPKDHPCDRHAWERACPKCDARLELQRKLPPHWNWTGMEVAGRFWKCTGCPYLEPAGR